LSISAPPLDNVSSLNPTPYNPHVDKKPEGPKQPIPEGFLKRDLAKERAEIDKKAAANNALPLPGSS
jgi:hypothetical protein